MAKYDEKFKKSVVQDFLAGGGGYRTLSGKYGVNDGRIRHWVGAFLQNGDSGLAKKFSHYSAEFKLRVCPLNKSERAGEKKGVGSGWCAGC